MKKIILIIILSTIGFFFTHSVLAATIPAVIVIRHAEEGNLQGNKKPPLYLTPMGQRHAQLYANYLDPNLITKYNLSPITKVIVIDPNTPVQPGGAAPTTNPYYTIKNYLDLHGIIPILIPTAPGMNEKVAKILLDDFNAKNPNSTLIVWESKKMDLDEPNVGTALLKLIAKDTSNFPRYQNEIMTTRDALYLFTNGSILKDKTKNKDYVKYNVTFYNDFFDTINDSTTFRRVYTGSMADEFGNVDPASITTMIFCTDSGLAVKEDCTPK